MNCTTCGTPLEPGAAFCAYCGTRVSAATSAGTPTVALPAASVEQRDQPPAWDARPQEQMRWENYPQADYAAPARTSSTTALISLIFGILAYIVLPFVGAIVAVIAGHMARNEIRNSNGQLEGNGLATAGLVLGYLQLILLLGLCGLFALGFLAALGG